MLAAKTLILEKSFKLNHDTVIHDQQRTACKQRRETPAQPVKVMQESWRRDRKEERLRACYTGRYRLTELRELRLRCMEMAEQVLWAACGFKCFKFDCLMKLLLAIEAALTSENTPSVSQAITCKLPKDLASLECKGL